MIRHLSQRHEIVVASVAHTRRELDEGVGLKEYCSAIYAEVVPDKVRWLQAMTALPSRTPSSVAYFSSTRLRQKVKEAAQKKSFDAVIVHCAFAAQYAVDILAKWRMLDFGDLDSGKWLDYAQWRGFPLRYGYAIEARKLRAYEKTLAESFDYCTLTTQGELEEFEKLRVARPHSVIPNGVDNEYFHPNGRRSTGAVIAFVGRMDYFPNIDGALYFVKEIFPLIRRNVPTAELSIVGSDPTPAILKLRDMPGITVTGHVPDVRPYLLDALVSVAPLRIARGTQNKILESMAMGIPVVATSHAAKGIQAHPDKHLLVAEESNAFADHVINLLNDGTRRSALSSAARHQVEEVHAWPKSMRILDDILKHSQDVVDRESQLSRHCALS